MTEPLLVVEDLAVRFDGLAAVDGVSFEVHPGEVLAVVGESGSGKTTMALAVLDLVPDATVTASRLSWKGEDLLAARPERRRRIRGVEVGLVFQDPSSSLNPVLRVGAQVAEVLRVHEGAGRREAWRRAIDLLEQVGISEPGRRARQYPHELSGGMRQRVAIAMAIACRPALLIADEPTSALDVTVQAQVLDVLLDIKDEMASAVLLITHDLGVVAGTADRTMVLYAGREVEAGPTDQLFAEPAHPYTVGLLGAVPRLDDEGEPATGIPGVPPALDRRPGGCAFHPRCPARLPGVCDVQDPVLGAIVPGRAVACHLFEVEGSHPR